MAQPAKSYEPSMEEILASIRRIIADDDTNKMTQAAEAKALSSAPPVWTPATFAAVPPSEPNLVEVNSAALTRAADSADDHSADILEPTESMTALPAQQGPSAAPWPAPAPHFHALDDGSDASFDGVSEKAAGPRGREERAQLISRATSAAVDSSFNTLAQTVLVHNARTIEDLVREMLQPLLKAWLDENLPGMVERLVRAEIERVSRGR